MSLLLPRRPLGSGAGACGQGAPGQPGAARPLRPTSNFSIQRCLVWGKHFFGPEKKPTVVSVSPAATLYNRGLQEFHHFPIKPKNEDVGQTCFVSRLPSPSGPSAALLRQASLPTVPTGPHCPHTSPVPSGLQPGLVPPLPPGQTSSCRRQLGSPLAKQQRSGLGGSLGSCHTHSAGTALCHLPAGVAPTSSLQSPQIARKRSLMLLFSLPPAYRFTSQPAATRLPPQASVTVRCHTCPVRVL